MFLAPLCLACDQDAAENPTVYAFDRFETGEVQVFTEGEAVGLATIGEAIAGEWLDVFDQPNQFSMDDMQGTTITLSTATQAMIQKRDSTINVKVHTEGNRLFFESTDTLYSSVPIAQWKDPRFGFSPRTQTHMVQGPATGIPPLPAYLYGYLACMYALSEANEIRIPFTNILEKNCASDNSGILVGGCSRISSISRQNNLFNPSFAATQKLNLTDRDTLAVQVNFVVFRKR